MTGNTFKLFHQPTNSTISFTVHPHDMMAVDLEAKGSLSSSFMPVEQARLIWKAWKLLGALDLRHTAIINDRQYKVEKDGSLSVRVVFDIYSTERDFNLHAPQGYRVSGWSAVDDCDNDPDDVVYELKFSPVDA